MFKWINGYSQKQVNSIQLLFLRITDILKEKKNKAMVGEENKSLV
jgi:hypothetical protein